MNKNGVIIRRETEKDYRITENLTRDAFWGVYMENSCVEHYVLHRFRDDDDFVKDLSLVMEKDGEIIGHIMYAKAVIKCDDGGELPIMTFGPVSISPSFKRMGYGTYLLNYSMNEAEKMGVGALAMTGNIDFYGKSGFVTGSSAGIKYAMAEEGDDIVPYFLVKELKKGYLDGIKGTFSEPHGYFVAFENPDDFAEFEKTFPVKE